MMRLNTLAFILMLAGAIHAADTCGVVFSEEMVSIFFLGIGISILLVSIWYLAGSFMHDPEIEASMKNEMQQIGLTILAAIIISGGIGLLCYIEVSDAGLELSSSTGGVMGQAKSVYSTLTQQTLQIYINLVNTVMDEAALGSSFGGASVFFITVTMSPFSAHSLLALTIAPVAQSILIAYFVLVFQQTLLMMTQSEVFLMLLPIGLCLRAFPITRKFGGTLAAVSIGLSFIYPLVVSFTFMLAGEIVYDELDNLDPFVYIAPFAAIMFAITVAGSIAGVSTLTGIITAIVGGGTMLASMGIAGGIDTALLGEYFKTIYDAYGSIMLFAFFLPALQILIVSALVRSLAGTLGSEIDLSGIMRAI